MEKVKFANGNVFNIPVNGIFSSGDNVRIGLVAPDTDLLTVESLVTETDNVKRIELLSESDEVLKVYSGYTVLTSVEKKKNVVVSTTIEEPTEEGEDPTVVGTRADVIYVSLRKENEAEIRLNSLEETVDLLVESALS